MDYPQRVFEADYTKLSPAQVEQTNRMGRRGNAKSARFQRCLANYVEHLKAISPLAIRAVDNSSLPKRVVQVACLRTVWLCDSEYLWSQHCKLAMSVGVTSEELQGVAEGPASEKLQGFDKVTVSAIDDLYFRHRLSDANWNQFDQFGPEGVTDFILVYGLYINSSCLARSFGTPIEDGSVGYQPEVQPLRVHQHPPR